MTDMHHYSPISKNTQMDFIVIRLLASEVGWRWEVPAKTDKSKVVEHSGNFLSKR
ncbi:hypothetical protein PPL_05752 [Heterostelium album PN500]|uniref:Uncharacterized protein n=1 Tax=Heterostelium pallidum (strain ATCC 26659 / Pp 5 / PN500) TaxID=670386 RepID=D3BB20_HETP5|nr:hypothetical protein PPL_05752 [Heterostelium album PN500]EFA81757.1 hypothetical protein PPL_05752 [Heterostelium album PN500]|eukprot:XP_020433874.1 hypothetical protein PPL_05752 [Heterostelium album PN500]